MGISEEGNGVRSRRGDFAFFYRPLWSFLWIRPWLPSACSVGRHARPSEEMHAPHWFIYCRTRTSPPRDPLIPSILIAWIKCARVRIAPRIGKTWFRVTLERVDLSPPTRLVDIPSPRCTFFFFEKRWTVKRDKILWIRFDFLIM